MRRHTFIAVTFAAWFTLCGLAAKGQVVTQSFDEIRNDPNSHFYREVYEPLKQDCLNGKPDNGFSFGLTKVIAPRDTFVTYIYLYGIGDRNHLPQDKRELASIIRKNSPLGYFGSYRFDAELLNRKDIDTIIDGTQTMRWRPWSINRGRIKHYREKKHFKIKAYFTISGKNKNRVIKCLTADVHYYPLDQAKSTVKYSVDYKKYRRLPKYGFPIQGPYGGKITEYRKLIEMHKFVLASNKILLNDYIKQNKENLKNREQSINLKIDRNIYQANDKLEGCYDNEIIHYQKEVRNEERNLKMYKYALKHYEKANRRYLKEHKNAEKQNEVKR